MVNRKSVGRYRHRIDIYDPNTSRSNSGYPAESEETIEGGRNRPAWVYGVGGSEPLRDQQVEPNITHIVEMRYLEGVKQRYHIKWRDRRLNILQVKDVDGRQRQHKLFCIELGT